MIGGRGAGEAGERKVTINCKRRRQSSKIRETTMRISWRRSEGKDWEEDKESGGGEGKRRRQ